MASVGTCEAGDGYAQGLVVDPDGDGICLVRRVAGRSVADAVVHPHARDGALPGPLPLDAKRRLSAPSP